VTVEEQQGSAGRRLMAVHAHPDDESSKGAATLARYAAAGAEVLVVTCTGGERGDVLNPALDRPGIRERLPEVRREEMARAARELGVGQRFLGFADSGLPPQGAEPPEGCFARVPVAEAADRLGELVQDFRPHVMVTYDPSGGYPHPDHVHTHRVARAAFEAAQGWRPSKLYYLAVLSRAWFEAMHRGMTARGLPSAFGAVLDDWPPGAAELGTTTRVECAAYFDARDRAFRAHATQADPAHPFFAHPREVEREVWPTEDYVLASSRVRTRMPETDLFAGIPAPRGTAVG
jgi:mycothiol S-conjugate amidase